MYLFPDWVEPLLLTFEAPWLPLEPTMYEEKLLNRAKASDMIGFVMGTLAATISAVDSTTFQASSGTVAPMPCQLLL
jgi:hypothetical protein